MEAGTLSGARCARDGGPRSPRAPFAAISLGPGLRCVLWHRMETCHVALSWSLKVNYYTSGHFSPFHHTLLLVKDRTAFVSLSIEFDWI